MHCAEIGKSLLWVWQRSTARQLRN